jgi:hypothetical protein
MAACRSSLENTRKMNLKPVLDKTSARAQMESEFDMLGVSRKTCEICSSLAQK